MSGILYICATPIGNLKDISERVLETLSEADIIAAEDTRVTRRLLSHFDIHTKLTSYHEHNRFEKADALIEMLRDGKNIALVTDAGTPVISDPGDVLVARCAQEGIKVTSLPGASAVVTACTLAHFNTGRFVFEGFLPANNKKSEREKRLSMIAEETRAVVLYEAPHRLLKTLSLLKEVLDEKRQIALCRELTKIHEEVIRGTIDEMIDIHKNKEPRGEYVIVIEGRSEEELKKERALEWEGLSIDEHVEMMIKSGVSKMDAMKIVAKERGISKREVYKVMNEK